jgi:transposase InsO family protein
MKKKKRKAGGDRKRSLKQAYPVEFRLRVVKIFLEEGYSAALISEQFGISSHSIQRWVRAYRRGGVDGLTPKPRPGGKPSVKPEVKERVIAVKKAHPEYGARRITDVLKRFFLIPTSQSTVHKTLSEKGLVNKAKHKPVRNPPKPRFFERARPNQMWQSDIMTFRLAGRNAYLIGFMDDYSRYITALGLYRSQTAEHVLETYRRGVAEYGVPKEMLTDNGRQYTNWRGKTRFEREMKKDRVKHIRSRPHHPMTLGKLERFWKSILGEFLQRAQFDSFEQAVERTAFWIKYYNHKRPHQGIGGLCPADRFFEIAHELKKTLQRGVEENALELALRGRPVDPFYMVGRMGGQSVVIRAEKGKVRMLVDEASQEKELVYDARKDIHHEDNPANPQSIRPAAENNGRTVDLERAAHQRPSLSGTFHQPDAFGAVAEPGDRGHAKGPGPEEEGPAAADQPALVPADRKEAERARQAGKTPPIDPEGSLGRIGEDAYGQEIIEPADGAAQSRDDHEGALRSAHCAPGRRSAGRLAQDVLQVGGTGPVSPSGQCDRPAPGAPLPPSGRPSPMAGKATQRREPADRPVEPQDGAQGCADGVGASPDRQRPGEKKMSLSRRRWP